MNIEHTKQYKDLIRDLAKFHNISEDKVIDYFFPVNNIEELEGLGLFINDKE